MKIFKDLFTGVDNETYDLGKILGSLSVVSFIVFTYLTLAKFNSFEFASGITGILAGWGFTQKIKESTEPKK